ncbi:gastrula zinc finger protein XlCGF7.1-like [Hyposmocoma kahamanoa]|uniref:gastrula zinc finger protein XlCGF7.1-like n=1 Tax=Hyposmocoma kahamanoa TaxID=1477025 RepID=UPI000E6D857E|nr:gastrula zinc finger protein XlCGF7.1-like [Hyposmocoma kahamanoa]
MESHNAGLVCAECGKVFNHRNTLKMHEKSHYVRLMCQICGRVYKNHNTYKKHIDNQICEAPTRRSQADAKFECDYCHKKYSQKMTLRVHIQYEHGNYKYLECKWCNKKFWCKSRLNAHIVKHTKERNFTCTTCNGKFVTKESLLYHTRIHTGERPYKCPHCDCRFLNSSRRATHVRSQHMDPIVQCDICQAKFKSFHFLHKHKKLHNELDIKPTNKSEKGQRQISEKHLVKRGEAIGKVIFVTDQLTSENIKLDLGDEENVELKSNTDRSEYVYQYQFGDGQDLEQDQQIYLEVTDDDDVIKVSENIEV